MSSQQRDSFIVTLVHHLEFTDTYTPPATFGFVCLFNSSVKSVDSEAGQVRIAVSVCHPRFAWGRWDWPLCTLGGIWHRQLVLFLYSLQTVHFQTLLKAGGDCTYVFLLSISSRLVFLFYEAAVRKTPQWTSQMRRYMVCRQRAICSAESPYCTVTCCQNATCACICIAVLFLASHGTDL